jgi:hypothetical protein
MENPSPTSIFDGPVVVPEVEKVLRETKNLERLTELFNYIEAQGVDLDSKEAQTIARHATSELGITPVNKFEDLSVEELTDYQVSRIIARARSGVKQILEMRTKYAPILKTVTKEDGTEEHVQVGNFGPFVSNRKLRRAQNRKHRPATVRPMKASDIINKIKQRKNR